MRGRLVLFFVAVALVGAFAASAAELVVLKDGRAIALAKPLVVKGKMAILTLPDKTVLSVPLVEIDKEKTADAKAKLAAAPAPATPIPTHPLTPAEAAKVKSAKKAIVSLTDDSVAHPTVSEGEGAQRPAEGGAKVEVGSVTVQKDKGVCKVTGSLMNTGKSEALTVTMTVQAVAEDGKVVGSAFAAIAKDNLTTGEKTTFTSEVSTPVDVKSFKYEPRWTEKVASRLSVASGSAGNGQGEPGKDAEVAPPPPPQKQEEPPKPIQRGDVAAPPANVPVGQPTEPGGVYVPQPSDGSQPKLP